MSQARKGGLGRGLAALIPTGPATAPGLGAAAADLIIGGEVGSGEIGGAKANPSLPTEDRGPENGKIQSYSRKDRSADCG